MKLLQSNEPGTILFQSEGFLCKVASHASNSHQVCIPALIFD